MHAQTLEKGVTKSTSLFSYHFRISRCFPPDIYVVLTIVGSWVLDCGQDTKEHNLTIDRYHQQLLYYNGGGGGGSFIVYGELYVPLPLCLLSGVMMKRAGTRYGGAGAVVSALIVYHIKTISGKEGH